MIKKTQFAAHFYAKMYAIPDVLPSELHGNLTQLYFVL